VHDPLDHFSLKPCPIFFNHPLSPCPKNFNQTLHENFQSNLAQKISGRPWLQKVKQICLNPKPGKRITVERKSGN